MRCKGREGLAGIGRGSSDWVGGLAETTKPKQDKAVSPVGFRSGEGECSTGTFLDQGKGRTLVWFWEDRGAEQVLGDS